MLLLAVDVDKIAAAIGERVLQRPFGLERLAALVECCHFEARAQLDVAAVGFELAGENVEQRRLAGAIRADDAEPVAAQDADREILHDGAVAPALADQLALGDEFPRGAPLADREFHIAYAIARLAALLPQIAEPVHAAHIALATPADAVAHPMLFIDDLAVELVAVALFFLNDLVAPGFELAKPAIKSLGAAAVEPDGGARKVLQEAPVMADQHKRRTQRRQFAFQPFDGGQVEMVGRLVEEEQVRLGCQHARERGAADLAARQVRRVLVAAQAKLAQQILRAIEIIIGAKSRLDIAQHVGEIRQVGLLRQVAHSGVRLEKAHPAVFFDHAGGDLEQRRLARAVAADKADALAGRDRQVGTFQQRLAAKGELDVLQGENRRGSHRVLLCET